MTLNITLTSNTLWMASRKHRKLKSMTPWRLKLYSRRMHTKAKNLLTSRKYKTVLLFNLIRLELWSSNAVPESELKRQQNIIHIIYKLVMLAWIQIKVVLCAIEMNNEKKCHFTLFHPVRLRTMLTKRFFGWKPYKLHNNTFKESIELEPFEWNSYSWIFQTLNMMLKQRIETEWHNWFVWVTQHSAAQQK